ncbi:kelch domain-containing protein [Colletotrichum zoysiae]|uniref:Kelch domain-containing protein n=1 Tax=Colletotrichum zoysiae TaxID=1216348 RepID=A0AAD9HKL1_9PEZI|nr:kelch domain-containing protein [Colletotrichum zoysiae]
MIPSVAYKVIAATSLSQLSSAEIMTCPGDEAVWTTPIGVKYTVCPGSTYQHGGSLQVVNDVQSTVNCVQICDTDARCNYAFYDKVSKTCHVVDRNNQTVWTADNSFDAIRMTNDVTEGTAVFTCPCEEATYIAPSTDIEYLVCLNTEYTGSSAKTVDNVASISACADLCSHTPGCKEAVFDNIGKVCDIKATGEQVSLSWVQNKRFAAIRVTESSTNPKAVHGMWGNVIQLPLIPVAAYIVPSYPEPRRMLFFSSWGDEVFSGATGQTQFGDYDVATGAISKRTITNTHHDMFCPGISQLEDGRIIISGGSDAESTSIYDPATNSFTRGPDLKLPRGYQTTCTLSNGKVFTIGGAYSGNRVAKNGEVYDPVANTWTYLPGADVNPIVTADSGGYEGDHAWLFGWKNGSIFQAGPSKNQHWYGIAGDGSVSLAGTRDTDDAMCGIWVMYDAVAGKILSAGGSPLYTNSDANRRTHITTIGEPGTLSAVERVADMAFPRGFANAVVLPDGQVLVTGGQRKSLVFKDTDSILIAELFNPITKQWKQVASMTVPRNYHSISILLPDGTVFAGGGGMCWVANIADSTAGCDPTVDHSDGEIFEPPYLFDTDGSYAARPIISALGSVPVKAGATLTFSVEGVTGQAQISLIRTGSVTHSVNSDQRRVPLNNVKVNGKEYSAELPDDYGILTPGYYYLFVSTPQGTPSIAKTVHIIL